MAQHADYVDSAIELPANEKNHGPTDACAARESSLEVYTSDELLIMDSLSLKSGAKCSSEREVSLSPKPFVPILHVYTPDEQRIMDSLAEPSKEKPPPASDKLDDDDGRGTSRSDNSLFPIASSRSSSGVSTKEATTTEATAAAPMTQKARPRVPSERSPQLVNDSSTQAPKPAPPAAGQSCKSSFRSPIAPPPEVVHGPMPTAKDMKILSAYYMDP